MNAKIDLIWQNIVKGAVFLSLLALPWINCVRISTFLFITLGIIVIVKRDVLRVKYSDLGKQLFFLIFLAYYVLQITAFSFYPEKMNHAALEQKASLLIIPLLFFILINSYKNVWSTAKYGFITGNVLATCTCLIAACIKYAQTGSTDLFFYHNYANTIGLSAIYFSFSIVIALLYTLGFAQEFYKSSNRKMCLLFVGIGAFLFMNLILLSSKTVLIIGSILLLIMLLRQSMLSTLQKITITTSLLILGSGILFTSNPISDRYKELKINTYSVAFKHTNFKDFAFDGLNLRLLLWRMGYEINNENKAWFTGNGGKHFHQILNEKIKQYSLYTGDGKKDDNGYLNYNLHNQYIESYTQFGIIGVLTILAFIISSIFYAVKNNNEILIYTVLFLGFVFLTESVMETQAGILLLTIFISGEWILTQQKLQLKQAK